MIRTTTTLLIFLATVAMTAGFALGQRPQNRGQLRRVLAHHQRTEKQQLQREQRRERRIVPELDRNGQRLRRRQKQDRRQLQRQGQQEKGRKHRGSILQWNPEGHRTNPEFRIRNAEVAAGSQLDASNGAERRKSPGPAGSLPSPPAEPRPEGGDTLRRASLYAAGSTIVTCPRASLGVPFRKMRRQNDTLSRAR